MQRFTQWRQMLGRAPGTQAVDDIIRAYVEALGTELSTLPPGCQQALRNEPDVHCAAVTLLQEELRFQGPDETRALLQEIAYTFAAAAIRAAALAEHAKPASQGAAAGHA
jgi:hypothetical protein